MKLSAGVLVLTAAAACAAQAAELCDYGELTVQLIDIAEPAFHCQSVSGYSFVPPSTLPTTEQVKTICAKCPELISAAAKAKLPTCALSFDNGNTVTVDKLFSGIASACAGSSGNKGNSSTDKGSSSGTGEHKSDEGGATSAPPPTATSTKPASSASSPPSSPAPSSSSSSSSSPSPSPSPTPSGSTNSSNTTVPPSVTPLPSADGSSEEEEPSDDTDGLQIPTETPAHTAKKPASSKSNADNSDEDTTDTEPASDRQAATNTEDDGVEEAPMTHAQSGPSDAPQKANTKSAAMGVRSSALAAVVLAVVVGAAHP